MDLELGDTRLIVDEAKKRGVLRNQLAYILATAKWETAHTMKPVREAYWLSEDWRRKNLRYYPWYGRGYVQLTWEDNYRRAGQKLALDLTTDPDVVMDAGVAVQILVVGMLEGWFTGKKLSDYITLQRSDFVNARRIVNGTDKAEKIADIAEDYDKALLVAGYGVDEPLKLETEKGQTMELKVRDWWDITRKLKAGGIGGVIAVAAVWAINNYIPGLGDALEPQITSAIGALGALLAAYMTADKAD